MAQIINTNLMSLNAQRNLTATQGMLAQSVQRLSTGLRVNSAKDDAAGLAIAERMNTQIRGMNVAIRNANDAISLAQTAEGALSKISDMGQRMRELAVQSMNATNTEDDRTNLNEEYKALADEIKRTVTSTKFNGTALFTTSTALDFQIGANAADNEKIAVNTIKLDDAQSKVSVVVGQGQAAPTNDISDVTKSKASLTAIDDMLKEVNTARSKFGAAQNRFEAVINTLRINSENQSAARSRIMDADFSQ